MGFVKLLQVPLIKVVDFGRIEIDLQSVGLEDYIKPLEEKDVDLGMLRNADEGDLIGGESTIPPPQSAFESLRWWWWCVSFKSPLLFSHFIAMKICFGRYRHFFASYIVFCGNLCGAWINTSWKSLLSGCVAAILLFMAGPRWLIFIFFPFHHRILVQYSGFGCI